MSTDEVIIRIIGKLDLEFGDVFNQQKVKNILEDTLCNYKITPKETLPAVVDDLNDKIVLYIISKKIDGLSNLSLTSYKRHLIRFANCMRKNAVDITAMDIRRHIANYAKTGVKNSTIATETDVLRGFFNWLEIEGFIKKSPMKKIKTVKFEKGTREPLTKEDLVILRNGAKTLRQKSLLDVLYSTGLRLAELVNLNKSDVDWQKLQIRVANGKGGKSRIVYINADARVHLKKYLMSRLDDCEALFVTHKKPIGRIGRRSVQREIDEIAKQSKIGKNVYPHLLRSSISTHLLNSGMNITSISEMLGHSSVETTMDYYAKLDNTVVSAEFRRYS